MKYLLTSSMHENFITEKKASNVTIIFDVCILYKSLQNGAKCDKKKKTTLKTTKTRKLKRHKTEKTKTSNDNTIAILHDPVRREQLSFTKYISIKIY